MCLACAWSPSRGEVALGAIEPFPTVARPWPLDGARAGLRLTWTGVAGFLLETGSSRVAFDPFVTRPGLFATLCRRARPDDARVRDTFGRLDAAFLGHAHFDHAMDLAALARASPDARVHGGPTVVEIGRRLGLDPGRLLPMGDGDFARVGPFSVRAVRSRHGVVPVARWFDRASLPAEGVPRTPFRWPRGEVLAWRVEACGLSLHVQGSAGLDDEALSRQPTCDVLIACLAARKGTPDYLARLCAALRPRVLVPCHHDDFFRTLYEPPRPVATLRWGAFLREAAEAERLHGTRLWLPVRGTPVEV